MKLELRHVALVAGLIVISRRKAVASGLAPFWSGAVGGGRLRLPPVTT